MRLKNSVSAPLLIFTIGLLLLFTRGLDLEKKTGGENIFLAIIAIEFIIFVLPGIFYCKIKGTGYVTTMNMRPFGFGRIPIIIFMFFVMTCGSILINLGLYKLGLVSLYENTYEAYSYISANNTFTEFSDVLYTALVFAIIPAVTEEFIFRGIIMTEYEKLGGFCSVFASAALFAMIHFSFDKMIIYFFGGIALALTAYVTRSVIPAMILHSLYNIFSLFGENVIWNLIQQKRSMIFFIFIISVMFLVFLMLSLGEAERLFRGYGTMGIESPAEKSRKAFQQPIVETILSPTFLMCAALYIIVVAAQ